MHTTVIHEAGHVAMARLFSFPVAEAKAYLGHTPNGYCEADVPVGDTTGARLFAAAGAAAELVAYGQIVSSVGQLWGDIRLGGWRSWRDFEAAVVEAAALLNLDLLATAAGSVEIIQ